MSELINDKRVFSLAEVMKSIQKTITDRYSSSFWVKAEMNKLNYYKHSGHCYPELVDKTDGKVIAEVRSYLWKSDYDRINQNFLRVLKEPLKDGIKILFQAKITFDTVRGLSLWIQDIDPSFTLGDLEKEKQETIQRLKEEGIFDRNQKLKLAILPQRIAIISVETSKGYKDFLGKIDDNSFGYKFFHLLFPSLLQGEKIVESIPAQLERIRKVKHHFDAVAIIRGGGGDVGLSSYNNYQLAKEIALFPLPIFTGIGHITNHTVTEMVSYKNLITPTDLANFFIQTFHNFAVPVQDAEKYIIDRSKRIIEEENSQFKNMVKLFRSDTQNLIEKNKNHINNSVIKIETASLSMLESAKLHLSMQVQQNSYTIFKFIKNEYSDLQMLKQRFVEKSNNLINNQKQQLSFIEKSIEILKPDNVLKRGYSISLFNGKLLTTVEQLKNGDQIETVLYQGKVISVINNIQKTKEEL